MGNSGMIAGAFSSTSGKADTVLTTNGDVLYYNSGRQRLAVGDEGQVLTVSDADLPAWEAAGGLSSPLTSDLVYNDNVKAAFGTGGSDSSIYHNGSNMFLVCATGHIYVNQDLIISATTNLAFQIPTTIVLVSGAITLVTSVVAADTESSASSDDFTTLDATAIGKTGALVTILAQDPSRTVNIIDTSGAIQFLGAGDFSLDNSVDIYTCSAISGKTHNYESSRSDNAS